MSFHLRGEYSTKAIWLNGNRLWPGRSQEVWNHSPDGFNWGYAGSGPAQLALAILLELLPLLEAKRCYQRFKFDRIAGLPQHDFDTEIKWSMPEEVPHD
jgi:hypothetical protein